MLCSIKSRIIFMLILALVSCVCSIELSPDFTLTNNYHDNSNTFYSTLDPEATNNNNNNDKNQKNDGSDRKKYNDNDNDKKYGSEGSSPSKTDKDNRKSNAKTSDDDDHKSKTESDATNTIVTTIIVIATETPTPTQIYTGNNQNPANQKGESSGSGSNGSESSNNGNASDPNNATSNNDNQGNRNRSNYRKMELALSIVGSVGGTALLAGLLILARRQINKKKKAAKKAQDLELGNSPSVPPMATAPSISGGSSRAVIVPHNQGNNDSVVIDFENPFSDPVTYKKSDQMAISPITPIAPVHLASGSYINFRQNQTLSMLSQTTAAVPSAPTEKEIAANENENPFELDATPQYYLQRMHYQHDSSHSHSLSHSVSHSHLHSATQSHSNLVSQNSFGSNRVENGLAYNMGQHLPQAPTTVTTNGINSNNNNNNNNNKIRNLSTSMSSPTGSSSDDLSELPPPAYTPSAIPNAIPNAIPSAPPLYALPNRSRSQQEEPHRLSATSTSNGRRHSISSITSNEARPFPLRRGSGSITRISTYFT